LIGISLSSLKRVALLVLLYRSASSPRASDICVAVQRGEQASKGDQTRPM
jgi:hypothetical protein